MNEKQIEELNVTLNSEGWSIIKEKLQDKIKELDSVSSIDRKQEVEKQVVELNANCKAKEILETLINDIIKMANAKKQSQTPRL